MIRWRRILVQTRHMTVKRCSNPSNETETKRRHQLDHVPPFDVNANGICAVQFANTIDNVNSSSRQPHLEHDENGRLWEKVECKLDSGANEWVITPTTAQAFPVKESPATRSGIDLVAVNGTAIKTATKHFLLNSFSRIIEIFLPCRHVRARSSRHPIPRRHIEKRLRRHRAHIAQDRF